MDTTEICSNLVALLVFDHGLILQHHLYQKLVDKLASQTLLSADIVCKHVTMVTNHGYVMRPTVTSANDNARNIV